MLTSVDKIKVVKYIKGHVLGDLYYVNMCESIGKVNKIKDSEFLEFFINLIISEFTKRDKISINYMSKLFAISISFVEWLNDANETIDSKIFDKIRSLNDYYQEYLKRTGMESDDSFKENYVNSLVDRVNQLFPVENDLDNQESLINYINEIDELNEIIASLRRELELLERKYNAVKKECDKKSISLVNVNSELVKVNSLLDKSKRTIADYISKVEEYSKIVADLSNEITNLNSLNQELLQYKQRCGELSLLVESLEKKVQENEEEKMKSFQEEKVIQAIKALIFEQLLMSPSGIEGLMKIVKDNKYDISRERLHEIIGELKRQINIVRSSFSSQPQYMIIPPTVVRDGVFNIDIDSNTKYYDIFLVSDVHIKDMNASTIKRFEKINDYCHNNNIKLILNLGDFFEAIFEKYSYDEALANIDCVSKAISLIPRGDGVYHAVLGGNHDRKMFRYGFDPLSRLSDEREDFINLGYNHCRICLNGSDSLLGQFAIHHPDSFNYNIRLNEVGADSSKTIDELEQFYTRCGVSRNESYIDIFGHMHKSLFNSFDSYYFLPAYIDRIVDGGACHLRVYLDEGKINYMIFMPLDLREKLVRTGEIVYKKVLNK